VCFDCKLKNDFTNHNSLGGMNYNLFKCVICKETEYKNGIHFNLYDVLHDFCGIYNRETKKYQQLEAEGQNPVADLVYNNYKRSGMEN
jgi:hypothetical protein